MRDRKGGRFKISIIKRLKKKKTNWSIKLDIFGLEQNFKTSAKLFSLKSLSSQTHFWSQAFKQYVPIYLFMYIEAGKAICLS